MCSTALFLCAVFVNKAAGKLFFMLTSPRRCFYANFVAQYRSPVIFTPLTTTIASVMGIPQKPGSEFIIAAYSSVHRWLPVHPY